MLAMQLHAQSILTIDSAVAIALRYHPQIVLAEQNIQQQRVIKNGSFSLENPNVWIESPTTDFFTLGVSQTIASPFSYIQQSKVGKQNILLAEKNLTVSKADVVRQTRKAYLNLQFAEIKVSQLKSQDSIFNNLNSATLKRYNAGDADLLEKTSAEAQSKEIHNNYLSSKTELQNALLQFQIVSGISSGNIMVSPIEKNSTTLSSLNIGDTSSNNKSPVLQWYSQNILVNKQSLNLERSKLFPGVTLGYLNQGAPNSDVTHRLQLGVSVPLWFWTYHSQIKSANLKYQMSTSEYSIASLQFNSEQQQAIADFKKSSQSLNYYETSGLSEADTIIYAATKSFNAGQISYIVYMQSLKQAFEIKLNYYDALKQYNESIIQVNYLNGQ